MTGVRKTACSKCDHCQVCLYKENYLSMIKTLEATFYSILEEHRSNMEFADPKCRFFNKKSEYTQRNRLLSPSEIFGEDASREVQNEE